MSRPLRQRWEQSFDRSLISTPWRLAYSKERRDNNRANGTCVNHAERKATHGCRCTDCYWRHAYGLNPSSFDRVLMLSRELRRIGASA